MHHQPKLHYDDVNDALVDLVQFLGGYKKVGARLWGEGLTAEDAADKLRHCLNKNRREKLSPHELLTVLRWGREAEFHGAKHFIDDAAGYERSAPVNPTEQKNRAVEALAQATEALERARASLHVALESETRLKVVKS